MFKSARFAVAMVTFLIPVLLGSGVSRADILLGGPSGQPSPPPVRQMVYLMAVQTDSAYVMAECNTTTAATVDFGTTEAYGSTAVTESTKATGSSTYVHRIKLTGLAPNTSYHFRVSQGATTTGDYTFTSAVNPGTNFRFAWVADMRSDTNEHGNVATRVMPYNPQFYLNGGDIAIDGTYANLKAQYFVPEELALIASTPLFLAPGNHEAWGTATKSFFQAPASASGTQDYYAFDYGDLHVLSLNYNVSYAVGSAQYNFAMSDLAATTKKFKLVMVHSPAYCSGGHGEDAAMKTMTTNIFEPKGVDLVLSGHSHFYQHNLKNGIHHVIIGTAGAGLYTPTTAAYTVKSVMVNCFGIVDVTPTRLTLNAYNDTNALIETIVIDKPSAPGPPVMGQATAGNGQATVDFAPPDADGGSAITGYTVTSSPAGGLDSNAGSTLLSHLVVNLTNDTPYTFTVTATNSVGTGTASVPSNSVTPGPPSYLLTVTTAGSGSGTVANSQWGLDCRSGSSAQCSSTIPYGTTVPLQATPTWHSLFSGWNGGGCSGNGACSVAMTGLQNVTATFTPNLTVKLTGGSSGFYKTLQEACNEVGNDATVQAQTGPFYEDLVFDRTATVTIEGGKDAGFNQTADFTTIKGSLVIASGVLIINNLALL